ncbi:START-like domain-containing protein [Hymenobacter sp. BT770]|uniref:START-like domain-containing protein n=1 Tax=Hymenobacter sp. BT770 TaxID=2886942 RepID=UPI001D1092E3|nr:START-like domain-containing protein [Hymenobacter sp. BT770]MCC3153014.1 ATPase [Hymenobacter sp. BT770]MDO3415073.1 START-like domain-containing protein [Hymenobacter sp. BT770]
MALPDTQTKTRFVVEFPINASPKILFPYLATASGLSQWFCDDVRYVEGQRLNFIWDQENHYAEISGQRLNRAIRFVFLNDLRQQVADANYLEFTLDSSQVTDEVYLRVIDYSSAHDAEEQQEMWEGLVAKLREQVGG